MTLWIKYHYREKFKPVRCKILISSSLNISTYTPLQNIYKGVWILCKVHTLKHKLWLKNRCTVLLSHSRCNDRGSCTKVFTKMIHCEMIAEIVDPLVERSSLNDAQNEIRIVRHYIVLILKNSPFVVNSTFESNCCIAWHLQYRSWTISLIHRAESKGWNWTISC